VDQQPTNPNSSQRNRDRHPPGSAPKIKIFSPLPSSQSPPSKGPLGLFDRGSNPDASSTAAQSTSKNSGKNSPQNSPQNSLPSQPPVPPIQVTIGTPATPRQLAVGQKKIKQSRQERLKRRVKVLIDGQPQYDPAEIAQWQIQRSRQRRGAFFYTFCVGGAIALLAAGGWLATKFILNPGSMPWLNSLVAGKPQTALSQHSIKTLKQVETELKKAGLVMGKPVYLSTYPGLSKTDPGFNDLFLPVLTRPEGCSIAAVSSAACQEMVELRVYRAAQGRNKKVVAYELIDRMGVQGPKEVEAIAPLVNAGSATGGSSDPLPLSNVDFVEGRAPMKGLWFNLHAEWSRGNETVTYGKLLRYDPVLSRLQPMMNWSSPPGELPTWQQVTGSPSQELVVDQSVGLEPDFQVYQVKILNPTATRIRMENINLNQPALGDRTYKNALVLAKNGLWSPAQEILSSIKQWGGWTEAAQAQLDVVTLHAKVTQEQAKETWSSPSQTIVALLMDGQWTQAWQVLNKARKDGHDVAGIITSSSDRLWSRIDAALKVSNNPDIERWAVLWRSVANDQKDAIAWLQGQDESMDAKDLEKEVEETTALLKPKEDDRLPPQIDSVITPSSTPSLADWKQTEPEVANRVLGAIAALPGLPADAQADPAASFGDWSVQLVELSGDSQPEIVVTVESVPASTLRYASSSLGNGGQSLVFSSQGDLLHSDFQGGGFLNTIAILEGGETALILKVDDRYTVRKWKNGSFE
jgi:hypothetical protein